MAINNIGINNQSFGTRSSNHGASQVDKAENGPTDSIQLQGTGIATAVASGMAAQILQANPHMTPAQIKEEMQRRFSGAQPAEAGAKAEITLTVTPSQLQSQAFQATMASLAASGVPVQVVLVAESAMAPTPQQAAPPPQPKPQPTPQPTYNPPAPSHRSPSYGSD